MLTGTGQSHLTFVVLRATENVVVETALEAAAQTAKTAFTWRNLPRPPFLDFPENPCLRRGYIHRSLPQRILLSAWSPAPLLRVEQTTGNHGAWVSLPRFEVGIGCNVVEWCSYNRPIHIVDHDNTDGGCLLLQACRKRQSIHRGWVRGALHRASDQTATMLLLRANGM